MTTNGLAKRIDSGRVRLAAVTERVPLPYVKLATILSGLATVLLLALLIFNVYQDQAQSPFVCVSGIYGHYGTQYFAVEVRHAQKSEAIRLPVNAQPDQGWLKFGFTYDGQQLHQGNVPKCTVKLSSP